jgi:hypothetical protein
VIAEPSKALDHGAQVFTPVQGLNVHRTHYDTRRNVRAGDRGGWSLVPALKLREHHATRIEWTNLNEFQS